MRSRKHRHPMLSVITRLSAILPAAALWIILVGGTKRNEMWVGGGVLVLSVAFLYKVWHVEPLKLDLRIKDLAQGWRIPWYIVSGVYEMIVILAKDLASLKRADSFYRVSNFRITRPDSLFIARRVLATAYTTVGPSFIVIGIDPARGRMLFHQLKRSGIPKMTQALGAQPEEHRS